MSDPMPANPDDDGRTRRLRLAVAAVAIVILTIVAYLPALNAGYIWDDDDYITNNALLTDLDGLFRIWQPLQTPQYYPVVFSTFWIEHQLWGLAPFGYHLVNVLLHLVSAALLWRILVRLRIPGGIAAAGLIAAVFALHPVHVESVAWITERKNVLSGVFYLAAALAHLRFDDYRETPASGGRAQGIWGWYGLALVLFVFALLSKSVTCSLPAALILVHLYQRKPLTIARLGVLAPMFILGLAAALNTAHVEREHVGAEGIEFALGFADRLLIASKSLLFYPWKIIWPHPLIFIYPRWEMDPGNLVTWWSVLAVLTAGTGLIWLYLKGIRGPFLALAFFAGTVFPALGFFNVYPHIFSFVADHFQYLASIGVITLIIAGAFWLWPRRHRLVTGIGVALLPVLAALTFAQSTIYEDERTLWLATVERNPGAWMSWNNLGHLALDAADLAAAEAYLRRCLEIKPDHFNAWSNLSEALRRQERFDEALESLQHALSLGQALIDRGVHEPSFLAKEFHQLGLIQHALGHLAEADAAYRRSLELVPDVRPVEFSHAVLLMEQERFDEAARGFRRFLEWDPSNVVALDALAEIAEKQARFADAESYYRRAAAAASAPAERLYTASNLVRFLAVCPDAAVRKPQEAVAIAERLVDATRGQSPELLDLLGRALAQAGRFEEAAAAADRALTLARAATRYDLAATIERRRENYRNRQAVWE